MSYSHKTYCSSRQLTMYFMPAWYLFQLQSIIMLQNNKMGLGTPKEAWKWHDLSFKVVKSLEPPKLDYYTWFPDFSASKCQCQLVPTHYCWTWRYLWVLWTILNSLDYKAHDGIFSCCVITVQKLRVDDSKAIVLIRLFTRIIWTS